MKTQAYLLALAAVGIALPAPQTVPHTSSGAAVSSGELSERTISSVCIDFTATNPNDWYYANTGPWGTATGTFASTGGQICVPTDQNAGGAMYIGSVADPGPGSTKLECFFPSSGTANCDVSLVDGFSLSVTCTADGASETIGGDLNLWKGSHACGYPEAAEGICINKNGYAATQSDVGPFFQPAVNNGQNYCIWKNCGQDYSFPTGNKISCKVTGTHGP